MFLTYSFCVGTLFHVDLLNIRFSAEMSGHCEQKLVAPINKNIIPAMPAVEFLNPVTLNNSNSTTPIVINTLRAIALLDMVFLCFRVHYYCFTPFSAK